MVGVEGMAAWLGHLEAQWADPDGRHVVIESARAVESEPFLRGLSAHLLVVAQRADNVS